MGVVVVVEVVVVDVGQAEVLQASDTEAGVGQAGAQHVHRVVLPESGAWLLGYNNIHICVHNYGYTTTQYTHSTTGCQ